MKIIIIYCTYSKEGWFNMYKYLKSIPIVLLVKGSYCGNDATWIGYYLARAGIWGGMGNLTRIGVDGLEHIVWEVVVWGAVGLKKGQTMCLTD